MMGHGEAYDEHAAMEYNPQGFRLGPPVLEGLGPDTPTATNGRGASQSAIPYAFHTMPATAVLSLAELQAQGDAKYGVANWRGITVDEHVNHAITHLFAYLAGDRQDRHLQHGAWRALAALEMDLTLPPNPDEEKGAF